VLNELLKFYWWTLYFEAFIKDEVGGCSNTHIYSNTKRDEQLGKYCTKELNCLNNSCIFVDDEIDNTSKKGVIYDSYRLLNFWLLSNNSYNSQNLSYLIFSFGLLHGNRFAILQVCCRLSATVELCYLDRNTALDWASDLCELSMTLNFQPMNPYLFVCNIRNIPMFTSKIRGKKFFTQWNPFGHLHLTSFTKFCPSTRSLHRSALNVICWNWHHVVEI